MRGIEHDWGQAHEHWKTQWLILKQKEPEDSVIASGARYFARRLVDDANEKLGIPDPLGGVWGASRSLASRENSSPVIPA